MTVLGWAHRHYPELPLCDVDEAYLHARGVAPEIAAARSYQTIDTKIGAARLGFSPSQQCVPALVVPVFGVLQPNGEPSFRQIRPHHPRVTRKKGGTEKPCKFETPAGARMVLDAHPLIRTQLADPTVDLFITEGPVKADAAISQGACCLALLGIWNWRGTNSQGGKAALADWDAIALNGRGVYVVYDSDVMQKAPVAKALERFAAFLEGRGARVHFVYLPGGENGAKVGLDDYLVAGHSVEDLFGLAEPRLRPVNGTRPGDVISLADFAQERLGRHIPPGPLPRTLDSPDGYNLTDEGNAQRLLATFGADLRHVDELGWLAWDGTRWREQGPTPFDALARARQTVALLYATASSIDDLARRDRLVTFARACESHARWQGMLDCARVDDRVRLPLRRFDATPWRLCCVNGVVDLHTGQLEPHRREDYFTRSTGVRYDPDARSVLWDQFFAAFTGEDADLAAFLQRLAGYSLVGEPAEDVVPFLQGPGGAGKSTFLGAVRAAAGEYGETLPADSLVLHKYASPKDWNLYKLRGARLVTVTEIPDRRQWNTAALKMLVGGDPMVGEEKYKMPFTFVPAFVLWLVGNHRPDVSQDDTGFWRRLRLLAFDHPLADDQQDPSLRLRLADPEETGPGVLAWAVRGCLDWKQAPRLLVPPRVRATTAAYREQQDPLREFAADRLDPEAGPEAWTPAVVLWKTYAAWCEETGTKSLSKEEFNAALRARGFTEHRRTITGARRSENNPELRGWKGVALRGRLPL